MPELAVHFFVFYAAILSALVPPIAVGIVVTTGIAEANFWKLTARAFRIGFPAFLLPFLFMYHSEIVSSDVTLARALTVLKAFTGMVLLAYAVNCSFAAKGQLHIGIYYRLGNHRNVPRGDTDTSCCCRPRRSRVSGTNLSR